VWHHHGRNLIQGNLRDSPIVAYRVFGNILEVVSPSTLHELCRKVVLYSEQGCKKESDFARQNKQQLSLGE
jgi:hypothetical protein